MKRRFSVLLALVVILGCSQKYALAQTNSSVLYVPLIGITMVPDPLVLPNGTGQVRYNYAVKNFLQEAPLTNVSVSDDSCKTVNFSGGDDNGDSKLDYNETWRYTCDTHIAKTTNSTATAIGSANNITAIHKAYATVLVGADNPPPLVSIINITKVAYPLSLPIGGGEISYTYKVTNPGVIPLSNIAVTDDKCNSMSSKLGDINNNNLLDPDEVWIYNCTVNLTESTTNTATVIASANGLNAIDNATLTVKVAVPENNSNSNLDPFFPNAGTGPDMKIAIWEILAGIVAILTVVYILKKKLILRKKSKKRWPK